MRCNTPTSFRLRPQIRLLCFLSWLIPNGMSLFTELSRYYSPSVPNINVSNLQGNITQQLLRPFWCTSWTNRRSSVSNPVLHALINAIILASVRVLMSFTWPRTGKSKTIPRTCRFCSTSPMCFLNLANLKELRDISSFRKIVRRAGNIHGTFMQISLWTGGMIISYNPLEMQFSIIIGYAPCFSSMKCSRLHSFNRSLFIHSATQSHPTLRSTCASIIYPSPPLFSRILLVDFHRRLPC